MNREQQLLRAVPDVLKYKTLLYIGGYKKRLQMVNLFIEAQYSITALEAWPHNAEELKELKIFEKVITGDVRDTNFGLGTFDVVMFWHGPEHIPLSQVEGTLAKLQKISKQLVIVASPWGRYEQGPKDGNPFERHRCSLYPDFFRRLGWKISVLGSKDRRGSNLIAWRRK